MSLLNSLLGSNPVRQDDKLLLPVRRPFFLRPRDVFEIIVALGDQATVKSLLQCVELRLAEPRILHFMFLNRWPTEAELAAVPTPYRPQEQLRALITCKEFRAGLFRRICDCYPERTRLLFIRIPRCAGEHFIATANDMHPIFPNDIAVHRPRDENVFVPALGRLLGRFTLTRTLMAVSPTAGAFTQETRPEASNPAYAESGLEWTINAPPRRAYDRLFTVIREPTGLMLSQVNAIVDALRQPSSSDTSDIAAWRKRMAIDLTRSDNAGLKAAARSILQSLPLANPICHALGNGTAADALRVARYQDIEIAEFGRYMDWVKYTWDVEPNPPMNQSEAHLKPADLTTDDRARLQALTSEDQTFYAAFQSAEAQIGDMRYSVRGRDL